MFAANYANHHNAHSDPTRPRSTHHKTENYLLFCESILRTNIAVHIYKWPPIMEWFEFHSFCDFERGDRLAIWMIAEIIDFGWVRWRVDDGGIVAAPTLWGTARTSRMLLLRCDLWMEFYRKWESKRQITVRPLGMRFPMKMANAWNASYCVERQRQLNGNRFKWDCCRVFVANVSGRVQRTNSTVTCTPNANRKWSIVRTSTHEPTQKHTHTHTLKGCDNQWFVLVDCSNAVP